MSRSTIKTLTLALTLITISSVIFGLMIFYVSKQGSELAMQIETLEKQTAQQDSYDRLKRISEETESERAELKKLFLNKDSDSIDFLNQVESLAPIVGVSLATTKLESITSKDGSEKWVEVGFSFVGSKERVQKFIKLLENINYVSRVNQVDLVAKSSTEWESKMTMQVRILAYDE